MLVKDLQKEFKFDLEIKNYSKRTIETYNYNIDQLMYYLDEHFSFSEIEEISTIHIKRFVQ
ncbi:phage integrase N-terminal SAM-like domain-containing protein [Peribacillus sp. ACCC06369]|uniref:phage integrase N-terminal SAM-like domain-containing protein n=1 Tax=Peribacillus sp. ACCC06369 TaxID=3055860 RepID=UPI0025A0D96A|nr:phage integrase N-terminal SAM-like domain-containing protein [Peribacillus sp. ACCC06369]MDM5358807.1 phage integrase N-terminal SAM-like domain-containing protein [Peribacillus sp. ACCC06369]